MTQLTAHFTFADVIESSTAERLRIDNSLPPELVASVRNTAEGMERVRAVLYASPVDTSSWYRCLTLNRILKSKDTSQHVKGEAVDFTCKTFGTPVQVCKRLVKEAEAILFDQLILEHSWVHISFNSVPGGKQKGQVLSLLSGGDYAPGLTDLKGRPI